mgnify:CR=1 FL=1
MMSWESIEEKFFNQVRGKLKGNLMLYCLTGSSARGEFIEGWSDLDVLLVTRRLSGEVLKVVQQATNNSEAIKIGVTLYSYDEMFKKNFLDAKTLVTLSLIGSNYYQPRIISVEISNLLVRGVNTGSKSIDAAEFAYLLHRLKRELMLLPNPNHSEKESYKLVMTLIKVILRHKGYIARNHQEAFDMAKQHLPGLKIKMPEIKEVISNISGRPDRLKIYMSFLDWLVAKNNSLF